MDLNRGVVWRLCVRSLLAMVWGLSSVAVAGEHEAGMGVSALNYDEDALESREGWHAYYGYNFDSGFGIELRHTELEEPASYNNLDVLYHFRDMADGIVPYLAIGGGEINDDTAANLGVGFKAYLLDDLMLRPDLRIISPTDDFGEYTTTAVSISLAWTIGSAPKAAPAPPKAMAKDSDKDGVEDALDACPGTPIGVAVNSSGCPLDSDGDGVYDYQDQCPETPAKLKVDGLGCPIKFTESVSIDLRINFDSNSAEVKPEYLPEISKVAAFLEQYQNTRVTIEGHTDTRGSASYNKQLSQRRADAVADVLRNSLGATAVGRVDAVGYGEEQPIADESTTAGLLANRRVVAKVTAEVEKMEER